MCRSWRRDYSKSVVLKTKTGKFPTILLPPTSSDVTDYSIIVRWFNIGARVTSINVNKLDGTFVKAVPLTDADNTASLKEITGLASTTTYIITIFSETTLRGTQNYTTTATPNLGNQIIDRSTPTAGNDLLFPGNISFFLPSFTGYVHPIRTSGSMEIPPRCFPTESATGFPRQTVGFFLPLPAPLSVSAY